MLDRQDTLRENLRFVRGRLGMSQTELAKIAEVGVSTVANFENGHLPRMADKTLSRLAIALGLSIEELNDPALKGRYRPPIKKAPEPPPSRAEFAQMLSIMHDDDVEETVKHMRYLIWKRNHPE